MALTIKNLRHNGIGTLRVYIKNGIKSTITMNCNRFEVEKKSSLIARLYGGTVSKAFYNGIEIAA